MGNPRRHYSYPGLCFTKLEKHLFMQLRRVLDEECSGRLYASRQKKCASVVELLFCRDGKQQLFRLRAHGLRPVCYQFETDGTALSREFRALLFQVLGERNLGACGLRSWVFQVYYPESVVRSLS